MKNEFNMKISTLLFHKRNLNSSSNFFLSYSNKYFNNLMGKMLV